MTTEPIEDLALEDPADTFAHDEDMAVEMDPPSVTIEASLSSPEIEAEQAAFLGEHPELRLITIRHLNDNLLRLIEDLTTEPVLQMPGSGSYELAIEDLIEGVQLTLTIKLSGLENAGSIGGVMGKELWDQMVTGAIEVAMDSTGEHRRRHIQELTDLGVHPAMLEGLGEQPLTELCALVKMMKEFKFNSGDIIDDFGGRPQKPKRGFRAWWNRYVGI